MSTNIALQSYKRPGLKTNLNSTRSLPKFEESKTSSSSVASTSYTSSSSKSDKAIKFAALSALGQTTSRQSLDTGNAVYKSGTRNINQNDFTLRNVTADLDVSIATGFAPTPRSARREINNYNADLQKYAQFVNSQRAYANGGTNKAAAAANVFGMLNQSIGSITKAAASTKASNPSNVTASTANSSSAQFVGKNSKEYDEQIESNATLLTAAKELKDSLETNIQENTETLNGKNTDLQTVKGDISTLNQQINALKSTIGKDPANAAANEAKIKQLETQLATKKKEQEALETEIKNLTASIEADKTEKSEKEQEIKEYDANINNYKTAQAKLEKSEQKDLDKSYNNLKKLAEKAEKETDETKKQQLIKEYKGIATTYNALVANTTVKGFQPVSEEPNIVDAKGLLAQSGF